MQDWEFWPNQPDIDKLAFYILTYFCHQIWRYITKLSETWYYCGKPAINTFKQLIIVETDTDFSIGNKLSPVGEKSANVPVTMLQTFWLS